MSLECHVCANHRVSQMGSIIKGYFNTCGSVTSLPSLHHCLDYPYVRKRDGMPSGPVQ